MGEHRCGRLGRHRVEHRVGRAVSVLAGGRECFAHHAELAAYAAHLRLAGRAGGELVLVDEATGAVVARLGLERPPRSRRSAGPSAPAAR